jgi:hypothetical protein
LSGLAAAAPDLGDVAGWFFPYTTLQLVSDNVLSLATNNAE